MSNSKSLKSPDLTAAQFEVQQIILNMTTCLNTVSSCHHCVLRDLCYAVASSVLNKMASAFLNSVHMGFHCMCKNIVQHGYKNFIWNCCSWSLSPSSSSSFLSNGFHLFLDPPSAQICLYSELTHISFITSVATKCNNFRDVCSRNNGYQ